MSELTGQIVDIALDRALQVALEGHAGQVRRGSAVPYAIHPLQVALALARLGAPSHVIQAGVLHDVVEDCDAWSLQLIAAEFGPEVGDLVAEVSENKEDSWGVRKEDGIASVATISSDAVLIKGCDKLHNLISLAISLETERDAEEVWARFRGRREGTLDTSRRMVQALCKRVPEPLAGELASALERIARH